MVILRPLTDEERDDMRSRPPLSEAERTALWQRRIATIEEYAEGALVWARQRAVQAIPDGKLPSRAEIAAQAALLLDELRMLGSPPTPRLVSLISFLLTGDTSPGNENEPRLSDDPRFQAAVKYAFEHGIEEKGTRVREIARAANVDHHTISAWQKRAEWDQEMHDLKWLLDFATSHSGE